MLATGGTSTQRLRGVRACTAYGWIVLGLPMTVILGGESVLFRPLPAAIALIEQNSRECMYRTGCPVFGSKLRPEGAVAFNTPLSRFGAKARIDHFRRSAELSCRVLRVSILYLFRLHRRRRGRWSSAKNNVVEVELIVPGGCSTGYSCRGGTDCCPLRRESR
jgi:hypothetical protein